MTWALTDLLPNAADRTSRQALVDAHFAAIHEGNFTGFTPAELAGFTTVQANTATELINAIAAVAIGQKKIIECAWNGVSSTGLRLFNLGGKNNLLTASGAIDWGYIRPVQDVLIRPKTGFAPVFQNTYSTGIWDTAGLNKIQLDGLTFEATGIKFAATATYPIYAMVALTNNVFKNNDGSGGNKFTIHMTQVRTMHTSGNRFDDCSAAFVGSPNYFRSWDNDFNRMSNNDVHGIRGYGIDAPKLGWVANIWVAGARVFNMSPANPTSGLHCDFLQISDPNETGHHWGYKSLVEMNVAHLDRGGSMPGTQGVFGSDGDNFNGMWAVHNNIFMVSAYHAALLFDPLDAQNKFVRRNIFMRAATPSATQDAYPWVKGARTGNSGVSTGAGGGTLGVSDDYAAQFLAVNASGFTQSGDITANPRVGAITAEQYQTLFSGNGSWGVDANGRLTYASPDAGLTDAAAAKAAIAAFAKPKNIGWNSAGPQDPIFWPRGDYNALAATGSPPPSVPGNSMPINVQVN